MLNRLGGLVTVLVLSGCFTAGDPDAPVAATRVGGKPAVFAPLCPDEGVESVYVTASDRQDDEGEVLWRIDASSEPIKRSTFILGQPLAGFSEAVALDGRATQQEVTAWVMTTSGELVGAVNFARIKNDGVYYIDFERVSEQSLLESRHCG